MRIKRLRPVLKADNKKVVLRPRRIAGSLDAFIKRFHRLSDEDVLREWKSTVFLFKDRHRNFEERILSCVVQAEEELNTKFSYSGERRKLLGAYLSMEYSIEAAALFNPSIVPQFDQEGTVEDGLRFIMSLRAVGEGHISSIEFIEGTFDTNGDVRLDTEVEWRTMPSISQVNREHYRAEFDRDIPVNERVLFPQTPEESNGMEDLRLVEFRHGGTSEYLGTYTAYDGHVIQSKLLRTKDFRQFDVHRLQGEAIAGKGIALFPRKLNGKYCAIGRQDGYSLTFMTSDDLVKWDSSTSLLNPEHSHDLTQLGNCGSPIETEDGWLLPTHGVGPVRRYSLGVALLDLEDPTIVKHYLPYPFMQPHDSEREGYVPNVLYTCGWLKYRDRLLIPYAMSDTACGFATAKISEVLDVLKTF